MLKAKKGNRVVRIPDEKKNDYKAMGYAITDMDGKVVYEPISEKAENAKLKAQVSDLEGKLKEAAKYAESGDKRIESLETENKALKAQAETLTADKASLEAKISDLESKLKEATKTAKTKAATKASDAANGNGKTE